MRAVKIVAAVLGYALLVAAVFFAPLSYPQIGITPDDYIYIPLVIPKFALCLSLLTAAPFCWFLGRTLGKGDNAKMGFVVGLVGGWVIWAVILFFLHLFDLLSRIRFP